MVGCLLENTTYSRRGRTANGTALNACLLCYPTPKPIEKPTVHYQPSFCTDTAFVDPNWDKPDLVEQRKSYKYDLLIIHLNINSNQISSTSSLKLLNRSLKSQVRKSILLTNLTNFDYKAIICTGRTERK